MGFNLNVSKNTSKLSMSDVLGSVDRGNTKELDLSSLIPYTDENGNPQPFHMQSSDELTRLAESIKISGLLQPIIVRPKNGNYEILAGHNRVEACRRNNFSTVTCIIKDNINDNLAKLIMTDTNLCQRTKIAPSVKAFAYKSQQDALIAEGVASSTKDIAESYGESRKTVQRYIKLTNLCEKILQILDDEVISFNTAYSLSYLDNDNQNQLCEYCDVYKWNISDQQAEIIKQVGATKKLDRGDIKGILAFPPKDQAAQKSIKFTYSEVEPLTDGIPSDKISEYMYFCLQHSELKEEFIEIMEAEKKRYDVLDDFLFNNFFKNTKIKFYTKRYDTNTALIKAIKAETSWRGSTVARDDFEYDFCQLIPATGIHLKHKSDKALDLDLTWTEIAKRAFKFYGK